MCVCVCLKPSPPEILICTVWNGAQTMWVEFLGESGLRVLRHSLLLVVKESLFRSAHLCLTGRVGGRGVTVPPLTAVLLWLAHLEGSRKKHKRSLIR